MADAQLSHLPSLDLGTGAAAAAGGAAAQPSPLPPLVPIEAPLPPLVPIEAPLPPLVPIGTSLPPLLPPLVPIGATLEKRPVRPLRQPLAYSGEVTSSFIGMGATTVQAIIAPGLSAVGKDNGTILIYDHGSNSNAGILQPPPGSSGAVKLLSAWQETDAPRAPRGPDVFYLLATYANNTTVRWVVRQSGGGGGGPGSVTATIGGDALEARIDAGAVTHHCSLERLGADELARAGFTPAALVYGWRAPAGAGGGHAITAALSALPDAHVHVHAAGTGAHHASIGGDALAATDYGAAGSNAALAVRLVADANADTAALVVHLK